MKPIVAIAILLGGGTAAIAAPDKAVLPSAFVGEWNTEAADCAAHQGDGGLTLSAEAIEFSESSGEVTSVLVNSATDIVVTAQLFGEGQNWQSRIHFQLSSDGTTLTDISDGDRLVRHRCPTQK